MSPPAGRGRKRLAAVALGIVGALLAAELCGRVLAHATHRRPGLRYDPDLGFRMRPDLVKIGPTWSATEPARTNSHGFRDAEHELAKAPGVFRIAALGDSFVYGAGVDYGQRFTEHLEAWREDVEVLNLGHSAFGTDQELRLLELEAFDRDPDLVLLVAFLGNDLEDIRYERRFHWPRPHYELEGGDLALVPPRATWDVRLREASYLAGLLLPQVVPDAVVAPAWEERDALPLFVALVERMDALCRDRGVHFLVALAHPPHAGPRPGVRARRARTALERAGLPVLDLFAAFQGPRRRGADLYAEDGGHWSEIGHRLVAVAVRDRILAEGWLR